MQDRYDIMQWRNEQIYHLRQAEPLTKEKQDWYFENVVAKLFEQEKPNQILFSFLRDEKCIGYGGLVHINWIDQHAEISFIMDSALEEANFLINWSVYLELIKQVAFDSMRFHKIYTYAFDLRPHLYVVLEKANFKKEAVLNEHCFFNGHFERVVIHSFLNNRLHLELASLSDDVITYNWASDPKVRAFSLNQSKIKFESHKHWFASKLADKNCLYFIAKNGRSSVGSFRIDIDEDGVGLISYLLGSAHHSKGLGTRLLEQGVQKAREHSAIRTIKGQVLKYNEPSLKVFRKLGFKEESVSEDLFEYKLNVG